VKAAFSRGQAIDAQFRSQVSDEAFQRLLLEFSEAAARGTPSATLIHQFCQSTRQFFGVDGTYFWRYSSPGELIGEAADGLMADEFRGRRLRAFESAAAADAVQQRKTVVMNEIDPQRYPIAGEFHARSLMAAPLIVANEVVGAAVFLHASQPFFFDQDAVAKATILAGQLGSLLEANRLSVVSREEQRRTQVLTDVAQSVRLTPDTAIVAESVAAHLRDLLHTQLVCILLRDKTDFRLYAVAAETAKLTDAVRAGFDRKGLQFAADIVQRAVSAGETISVAIDPAMHSLGNLVPAGMLLASPFRTSLAQGAILVYPRHTGPFRAEEKSLLSAVAGFGAVAISNAELCGTARAQAQELQQLLDISSELGALNNLDEFLQRFVIRATDFLGFGRGLVALLEDGVFRTRWNSVGAQSGSVDATLPDGVLSRALLNKQALWSDNASELEGVNQELITRFNVRQFLAVPLLGSGGRVLGMFAVLDRLDGRGISQADVRSAQALSAQVAVAFEATHNLDLSERHRSRAESLIELALELNSQLHLPECANSFARHAAALMGAQAAALFVKREAALETIVLYAVLAPGSQHERLQHRLEQAVADALAQNPEQIISSADIQNLDAELISELGWEDFVLSRLQGPSGELFGVLCLANRRKPLDKGGKQLLSAIAAHASVALENAGLFTRMHHANRHWTDIFDAITDFIVAHDQADKILRVNRSLADFIGVTPHELVGVNMGTLLTTAGDSPSTSCPFCRNTGGRSSDEYVLPVLDRIYLVSSSRVHSASSEGSQTIHVLKDITDRREAERRYRELFDNTQEGVFFATPEGRFVEVNDALVRLLGYSSREDLLQADIRTQVCLSPERFDEFTRQMADEGAVRNHEQTLRRVDGTAIHVLINAFAVRDAQQRIVQHRGVMLDISGLKTFQSELQRERDFSGKILNNTQSLILVVDAAGLVSYANRRWYEMGFHQHQLLGRPLEDLIAAPRRPALVEALAATRSGQQVDNLELQIIRGEGRVGHFSVNLSPMRDEQDHISSIVVVMSDITDAATLQGKLMHAEKMAAVGQLVSGVAHEVNNPLTAILGFADLLLENPEVPESARKDLRVILQEAQRTKHIVQNLLSFARPMPPQRKPVHLNVILRQTVQLRAYDLHSRGVDVVEHLPDDVRPVIGDSHQLQQVFLNILNNAYDAVRDTGRPARIEIKTANIGNLVEIVFRDNGHGVTFPDRIFDPFFTTKEVGKGTGLGLSICYGIVREHGGEILCHNNPDAPGATFVVRLPAVAEVIPIGIAAGVPQL